jgi:hypothetical protein
MGDNAICDSGPKLNIGPLDFLPFLTNVAATDVQASAANSGIIQYTHVGTLTLAYCLIDDTLATATVDNFYVSADVKVMIFNETDLLSQWDADLINLSRPSKMIINDISLNLDKGRYLLTTQGITKLKNMCIPLSVFGAGLKPLVAPITQTSSPTAAGKTIGHADPTTCSRCSADAAARLLPPDDAVGNASMDTRILHARLGHASARTLKATIDATDGLLTSRRLKQICPACAEGKATKLPFGNARHEARHVFDTVSVDIIGPMNSLESFLLAIGIAGTCPGGLVSGERH